MNESRKKDFVLDDSINYAKFFIVIERIKFEYYQCKYTGMINPNR